VFKWILEESTMATINEDEDIWRDGAVTVDGGKKEYGVSRSRLYDLMGKGELPYSQIGAKRYIPRRALARLLARGMVGGTDAEKT
jgi:hypothetical protein